MNLGLSLNSQSDFLISPIYAVAFEGCQPFKSSGSLQGEELLTMGELQQQWPPASLSKPLRSKAAIRAWIPNIWRTESFFAHRLLQAVCKLFDEHAQLLATGPGVEGG